MLDELDAARHEVNNMSVLCDHPTRTLHAIGRECDNIGITEQVGKIQNPNDEDHANIWEITPQDT